MILAPITFTRVLSPLRSTVAIRNSSSMIQLSEYAQSMADRYQHNKGHSEISKFINILTKTSDKRELVEKHVIEGMHVIQRRTNQDSEMLFSKAIELLSPVMDVGSFRKGSKIVRVPLTLTEYRSRAFAYRWLKDALTKKTTPRKPLEERFASEVLSILEGKSSLLQKKANLHKEALTNRTNARHRWMVGQEEAPEMLQ